jgi:hypothetical protein
VVTALVYALFEGYLAPGSPERHNRLDNVPRAAAVISHMYTGSHDALLNMTNVFKQPLHFKAVIEPVASKRSF